MTVLLTGYEPFGEHEENPTEALAARLDGRTVGGDAVVGAVLPVEFDRSFDELVALIDDHVPDVVLSLGLAAGRTAIAVERVGLNVNDTESVPDNADRTPHHEPIVDGGPPAYFATIPVVETVEALLDAGIPARVSNTAGTHLCNNVLYATRHHVEAEGLSIDSGFVHVPLSSAQAAARAAETAPHAEEVEPSLPLSMQTRAVEIAIETAVAAAEPAPRSEAESPG